MKITKYIIGLSMMAGTVLGLPSCTDLSETVYDQVMSKNYYNTKQDVINAVFRPFEHMYCCIWIRHENEELPADQLITPLVALGGTMEVCGKCITVINMMISIRATG